MEENQLSVLIPAAGESKRLGQPKQLLDYHGKPLLDHIIEVAASINPSEIIVITGAHSDAIRRTNNCSKVKWVHNPDWATGMGGSIALGAKAANPESAGLMILLCDQYRVTGDDLRSLLDKWLTDPHRIASARADGRHMPPLIFPSSFTSKLAELDGEQGARGLLASNSDRVIGVAMENADHDLDTPIQLRTFKKQLV